MPLLNTLSIPSLTLFSRDRDVIYRLKAPELPPAVHQLQSILRQSSLLDDALSTTYEYIGNIIKKAQLFRPTKRQCQLPFTTKLRLSYHTRDIHFR